MDVDHHETLLLARQLWVWHIPFTCKEIGNVAGLHVQWSSHDSGDRA